MNEVELIPALFFVFFVFLFSSVFLCVFMLVKWETRPWTDHTEKIELSGLDENLLQSTFVPTVQKSCSDTGTRLMEESGILKNEAPLTRQFLDDWGPQCCY